MAIAANVMFLMVFLSRDGARIAVRACNRVVRERAQFNLSQRLSEQTKD
jgi:hypothetical protein